MWGKNLFKKLNELNNEDYIIPRVDIIVKDTQERELIFVFENKFKSFYEITVVKQLKEYYQASDESLAGLKRKLNESIIFDLKAKAENNEWFEVLKFLEENTQLRIYVSDIIIRRGIDKDWKHSIKQKVRGFLLKKGVLFATAKNMDSIIQKITMDEVSYYDKEEIIVVEKYENIKEYEISSKIEQAIKGEVF